MEYLLVHRSSRSTLLHEVPMASGAVDSTCCPVMLTVSTDASQAQAMCTGPLSSTAC